MKWPVLSDANMISETGRDIWILFRDRGDPDIKKYCRNSLELLKIKLNLVETKEYMKRPDREKQWLAWITGTVPEDYYISVYHFKSRETTE